MGTDADGTTLPWVEAIARSFPHHDFVRFHTVEVPQLDRANGHLVAADLRDATPLAFRTPGGLAYTWRPTDRGVEIVAGDDAPTVVELDEATFSELVEQLLTAAGAALTERATLVRGQLADWQRWEPAMRSLVTGMPVYSEAVRETLVDRRGAPLDLHRVFEPADDPDEMRHFLATAGYLHVRGVFTRDEVAHLADEVEHVRALTTPGDPFSWWSVDASGAEVVTRINYLGRHSPALQGVCHDPRLAEYARLATAELRVCDDRVDGPMSFIKNSDVVKGNGDLGWHVDDGLGGHPVMCPLLQAGIQLDVASAANGQLMVLAGSHRYTKHWLAWGAEGELPVVHIDTQPGDLTLHYGDTMHSTPPPTRPGAGRRVVYVKFAPPRMFDLIPAGCHYNDALFHREASGRVGTRASTY
jgi:hypothetical protein